MLANALGHYALPSLKQLLLDSCGIDDNGFVALAFALEQNTSLQILDLVENHLSKRGFMGLAESLPNIKGLQQIKMPAENESFLSTLPVLLEGFRKNASLVEVQIQCSHGEWLKELKFWGRRNRFTHLLKASSPAGSASPQLGI
jgi:Ran GTPase-activating protein (RanGAP) involved in mRNA processing and transport